MKMDGLVVTILNWMFNPLKPNDPYRGRTAPLTSKRCILYIYSTNICTEYFKHGIYSPFFFPRQNAVCFIILKYLVHVLFTFYIQGVLKLKRNSGAKRLMYSPMVLQYGFNFMMLLCYYVWMRYKWKEKHCHCCSVTCRLHIWPVFGHSKCFCSYVTVIGVWSCVWRARSSTYIEVR